MTRCDEPIAHEYKCTYVKARTLHLTQPERQLTDSATSTATGAPETTTTWASVEPTTLRSSRIASALTFFGLKLPATTPRTAADSRTWTSALNAFAARNDYSPPGFPGREPGNPPPGQHKPRGRDDKSAVYVKRDEKKTYIAGSCAVSRDVAYHRGRPRTRQQCYPRRLFWRLEEEGQERAVAAAARGGTQDRTSKRAAGLTLCRGIQSRSRVPPIVWTCTRSLTRVGGSSPENVNELTEPARRNSSSGQDDTHTYGTLCVECVHGRTTTHQAVHKKTSVSRQLGSSFDTTARSVVEEHLQVVARHGPQRRDFPTDIPH